MRLLRPLVVAGVVTGVLGPRVEAQRRQPPSIEFGGAQVSRVVYAAFQLPGTHNAVELAQEIAGAAENMVTKTCALSNYSSHGTGGGFSQTIFDCGSKSFNIITVETLRASNKTSTASKRIDSGPLIQEELPALTAIGVREHNF